MTDLDDVELKNIDPEDIGDIVLRLGKSFGIKYSSTAFEKAKTFGDLCDVIESHINFEHQESCTTQQAFYKIRKAISLTLDIEERRIELDTELESLFPRQNRRRNFKELQQHLGIKVDILRMKEWLVFLLFSSLILSFIAFFFSWKIAISGLILFYVFSKIAGSFSNELDIRTIRQLTEKITSDNYLDVRRYKGTVNKKEIFKTIQNTFSTDLGLDKMLLTRDALLS